MTDEAKKQKMLARVEALLAKAESSEFEAEKAAFVGKAQALMTEYAIDEAMLRKASDAVDMEMDHIVINLGEIKYSLAVSMLIAAIADANHCFVVVTRKGYNPRTGKMERGLSSATVFGTPASLDCVGMLVTSLHKQMEIALKETPVPQWEHGKTFRNNFVIAYAQRIKERLRNSVDETLRNDTRAGVALVLVNQKDRATDAAKEHFPNMGGGVGPSGRRSNAGQQAGREAGNRASLAKGEIG